MEEFASRLQRVLKQNQNVVPVAHAEIPRSPEEWADAFDLAFANGIVHRIGGSLIDYPNISRIYLCCGDAENPSIVFEMSSGEEVSISVTDLILAFSPRH